MKSLVFDTGPVISLSVNNLLWLLEPLKERFNGEFYITRGVERELVTKPLESKKFKFEALQILQSLKKGALKIVDNEGIHKKALELLNTANQCFRGYDHNINIVSYAEMESLAAALCLKSEAIVVDERTTKELIERPLVLRKILSRKIHTNIEIDKKKIWELQRDVGGVKIIRSFELVAVAYELGLLDRYIADIENPKKTLLESILWAVKLNGCTVSNNEIEQVLREEIR